MDVTAVQQRMLDAYGIRVEPEIAGYVVRRLQQAGSALRELPVIGGDARTGIPVRRLVDATQFAPPPPATSV